MLKLWFAMLVIVGGLIGVTGCGNGQEVESKLATSGNEHRVLMESPNVEQVTFQSESLDKEMKINVYLPPNYNEETEYPVLYLLHGYGGDENQWIPELKVHERAEKLIKEGKIKPSIIVSVGYGNSYGINSAVAASERICSTCVDSGLYQDFISHDLISYVDQKYSTIPTKDGRYIGGLSMGGFAALHTAFSHPELFSKAGGHSPAIWMDYWADTGGLKSWLYPNDAVRKERDPIALARVNDLAEMTVYLDCGDQDYYRFYEGAEALYRVLQERGVESEYHLNEGKHDGEYWVSHIDDYLLFYAGI